MTNVFAGDTHTLWLWVTGIKETWLALNDANNVWL